MAQQLPGMQGRWSGVLLLLVPAHHQPPVVVSLVACVTVILRPPSGLDGVLTLFWLGWLYAQHAECGCSALGGPLYVCVHVS